METVKRIDVARREVNAAILMFLNDYDPIAIHTVAAAGLQIISDLSDKDGGSAGFKWLAESVNPKWLPELEAKFREPQNFFKHADRKGNDTDSLDYRPESIESYLMLSCIGYHQYTGTYTPEMRALMLWTGIYDPQVYNDSTYKSDLEAYRKANADDSPEEHKRTLLETIGMMRKQKPATNIPTDYS